MITKSNIASYEQRGSESIIRYNDDSWLFVSSDSNNGNIGEFRSIRLYRDSSLVALAATYGEGDNRFWSPSGITQPQLATYWNTAVREAERLHKLYLAGQMDEDTWRDFHRDFWDITTQGGFVRKSLEKGELPAFGNAGRQRNSNDNHSAEPYS